MDLICPQCGAVNSEESPDFPLCHNCHENLVKCGYCQYFDSAQGKCLNPKVGESLALKADSTPDCGQYSSTLAQPGQSRLRRRLPAAAWVGVILALLVILVIAAAYMISPPLAQQELPFLKLTAESPLGAKAGEPLVVTFTVVNDSARDSEPIRLGVSGSLFQQFQLVKLTPAPSSNQVAGGYRYFHYPKVPSGGGARVRMVLIGNQPGYYDFRARVLSSEATPPVEVPVFIHLVGESSP